MTSMESPRLLKQTTSRCTICHAPAPAEVVSDGGKVFLRRTCAEHGEQSVWISNYERFYYLSKGSGGCGASCGCHEESGKSEEGSEKGENGNGGAADPFEVL